MSRDRSRRHASALELQDELRAFERSGPAALARWMDERRAVVRQRTSDIPFAVATPFRPDPALSGPVTLRRPSRARWLLAALVPLGALVGAGLFLLLDPREREATLDAGDATVVQLPLPAALDAGPPSEQASDAELDAGLATEPPQELRDAGRPRVVQAPKRKNGFITVDSQPTWATVSIDGRSVGPTPVFRRVIATGDHRVDAVTSDGRKKSKRVTVKPDAEARVLFEW
jgi:hypothetical protein